MNWNPGEKRTVEPRFLQPSTIPQVSIHNRWTARFILLDAFRRYEDRFLEALRSRMLAQQEKREKSEAKELVLQVLEEVSGHPRDAYLKAAAKAQEAELQRFKID